MQLNSGGAMHDWQGQHYIQGPVLLFGEIVNMKTLTLSKYSIQLMCINKLLYASTVLDTMSKY